MSFLLCDSANREQDKAKDKKLRQLRERMKHVGEIYNNDPHIAKWGYRDDAETFRGLFKKYVHKELDLDVNQITNADIRIFKMGVKEFAKDLKIMGKGDTFANRFRAWFKLPSATMRKVPELKRYQDDLMRETAYYRLYQVENAQHTKVITDVWESLAVEIGGKDMLKAFRDVELKLDRNLSIKSPNSEQMKERGELKDEWSAIMMKGAQPVLKDIQAVINGADINTLPGYTVKQREQLRQLDKSMMSIRQNGVKIISSALKKVMETAKDIDKKEGSTRNLENMVKEIANSIKLLEFQGVRDKSEGRANYDDMIASLDMEVLGFSKGDKAHMTKYMPHKLLGMVKLLGKAQQLMINPDATTAQKHSMEWENFRSTVESAMHTSAFDNAYFSRDPAFFLKQYTHEISQFNFQSHLENTFRKNTSQLLKLHSKANTEKDRELADATASLIDQMMTMKSHLVGIDPRSDSAINGMARLLTGVQYFRLMGGNFRSAARNGTQRLYEVIHYGFSGLRASRKYYRDNPTNVGAMKAEAKKHGMLWFFESKAAAKGLSRETGARGALEMSPIPKGMRLDEDGTLRRDDSLQIGKKVTEGVAVTADWMGGMHRNIENRNRAGTFRTAYALQKMNLEKASDYWVAKQMGVTPEAIQKSAIKDKVSIREKWERRKAGNLAYNMVTDLHFEYAKWAKSPSLEGSAPGKVVGQFMHYRFSLFDLMSRVWKDGWKAIKAGDINRDEAWRLYRLGMMQSIIQGTSLTMGWNFAGLVTNDVFETLESLGLLLMKSQKDEEFPDAELQEKIEKKTFDTGWGMFMGASINHALDVGEVSNLWERDENGLPKPRTTEIIATGSDYEKQQRYEKWSLFNNQAARLTQYTLPMLFNRGIMDAFRLEMGGFLTKEQKEKQGKHGKLIRDLVPEKARSLPRKVGIPWTLAEKSLPKGVKTPSKSMVLTKDFVKKKREEPLRVLKLMRSLDYMKGEATPGQVLRES